MQQIDVRSAVSVPYIQQSDEQLVMQAGAGHTEAIGALYGRYFQPIYDFTLGNVRGNQKVAEDVVLNTFAKAVGHLQNGSIRENFKSWLYTTARREVLTIIRKEQVADKHAPKLMPAIKDTGSDPQRFLEQKELRHLVWEAMAVLRQAERELLELYMRQDFTAPEIAAMRSISLDTFYQQRSRAKAAFKKAMYSVILLRQGRRNCPEFDDLLSSLQATELTRSIHKAIQKHMADCSRCQAKARRHVYPLAIYAGLDKVSVPPGLQESLWARLSARMEGSTKHQAKRPTLRQRFQSVTKGQIMTFVGLVMILVALIFALLLRWGRLSPTPVSDPPDVHSTSHVTGEPSTDNIISISWTQQDVAAYSVLWSERTIDLPDQEVDLPGNATGAISPALADGAWYFHLRTQGENGVWTSTVHRGPFIIAANDFTPTAVSSPIPTHTTTAPAPTSTAVPTSAPTTSPTAVPCGPPPGWVIYNVQPGDTYFALAQRTNSTIQQIQQANCATNVRLLAEQSLFLPFIPPPLPTATLTTTPTHTATATEMPKPTATSSLTATALPSPTTTPLPTATTTPTMTAIPSPTPTSTMTATHTPSVTPSSTPTPTDIPEQ